MPVAATKALPRSPDIVVDCEAFAVLREGTGPLRKYTAVALIIVAGKVTAQRVIETSAHLDLAQDAARRALWRRK